jgi:hypothetical protein
VRFDFNSANWTSQLPWQAVEPKMRVPTSVILENLLNAAPDEQVSLAWVVENLRDRSFGIVILLVALVGLVPGVSPIAGILLAIPAIQMMLGREEPVLPRRLAARRLSKARLTRLIRRLSPTLQRLERVVRPRWATPFGATKRTVGAVVLLLGVTLLAPLPFSHFIPILATMLIAFAFLEEDGLLLCIALAVALMSLAITAVAIWGAIEASTQWQ